MYFLKNGIEKTMPCKSLRFIRLENVHECFFVYVATVYIKRQTKYDFFG